VARPKQEQRLAASAPDLGFRPAPSEHVAQTTETRGKEGLGVIWNTVVVATGVTLAITGQLRLATSPPYRPTHPLFFGRRFVSRNTRVILCHVLLERQPSVVELWVRPGCVPHPGRDLIQSMDAVYNFSCI
jgi:hypothetical protein